MLLKRKGFKLDVSSSAALAASLDKCVVRSWSVDAFRRFLTTDLGSICTGIQYAGPHHGDEVHALRRIFLLWERFQRYVWTLRARKPDLHAFHESDQAIRWYVDTRFAPAHLILDHTTDVLAHRQLAAAISHVPLHPALHSKSNVERIMDVINRRHRMAQMAGRASVEFYVGLALKGRAEALAKASGTAPGEGITEDAFVIRTFRNGVGVFVFQCVTGSSRPYRFAHGHVFLKRLGLEGLVTFKRDVQFDADNYTVVVPPSAGGAAPVAISVFDKVKVRIEVEKDKNTQRGRVKMALLSPVDSRGL